MQSRSNTMYKYIEVTSRTPAYLEEPGKRKSQSIIARFRTGSEENGNKYWLEEEERLCRICLEEEETIRHWATRCVGNLDERRKLTVVLGEAGE